MRANTFKTILVKTGFVASILLLASGLSFAQSVVNLTAQPANAMLPDGQSVPMWGYTCTGTPVTATCAALNPSGGWSPVVITVPYAGPGTSLTINLTNNLQPTSGLTPIPTSLVIVGQLGGGLGDVTQRTTTLSPTHPAQGVTWFVAAPDAGGVDCTTTSAADAAAAGANCPPGQAPRVQSFATEVPQGATSGTTVGVPALTWTNLKPGTYLIHSGTHPSIQSPMGLYGVLVVTTAPQPAGPGNVPPYVPGNAYPTSASGVAYDSDVPLLLSEIDPVQNRAVAAAVATMGFIETKVWSGERGQCGDLPPSTSSDPSTANTCYPPTVNYDPRYYLINGVSFDRTNLGASTFTGPSVTDAATTGNVLLRFVNAGLRMHVPSVVNSNMTLYAEDGNVLPGVPKMQTQVFLAAGKTYDVTVRPAQTTPATDPPTYAPATFAVYDRQLSLSTNNQRDGGMQAYVKVAGGAGTGKVGSGSSGTSLSTISSKTFYCVAGVPLTVADPSKGVLAGIAGANGAVLDGIPSLVEPDGFTFQANGTFTYTTTGTACGGTFAFKVNGTISASATIAQCDANSQTTGCPLGVAPIAVADAYTSTIATRLQVSPPGVLINDTDPSGLPLNAALDSCVAAIGYTCLTPAQITLNNDGSFTATPPGPGNYMFSYHAVNSQKRPSTTVNVSITSPTPSGLVVAVKDAKNGRVINDYRWIIEEDRTFYVDPANQTNTGNGTIPSLGTNFHTSYMPVVASGCVVPVAGGVSCEFGQYLVDPATGSHLPAACDVGNGACRTDAAQKTPVNPSQVHLDPAKRYYISILPGDGGNPTVNGGGGPMQVDPLCNPTTDTCAMRQFDIAKDCPNASDFAPGTGVCGHAMGGAQIPAGATRSPITISLQQTPLTTAKISVMVFEDDFPLNGEQDAGGGVDILAPNEPGLGGFELKIFDQAGGFGDSTGQATYDMFNMPLSNALAGTIDPITGQDACPITQKSDRLVGMIPTCPRYMADGKTLSPLAGQALIANLYPGLYEIVATPGADRIARGEEWLQTNTLDGTKPHEAFIKPNEPGYFQEFGPGGYHVAIGFANPAIINARQKPICDALAAQDPPQPCTSTINGLVTNARMSRTPDQRVYSSGSYDSYSFTTCYVSLGYPDSADFAFTKCNPDGTFKLSGIPTGNFKVTVFDQWNDLLVDGLSTPVTTAGSDVNVEIAVTQWRTNIYTRTFIDVNGDGVSQPDEPGLALVNTNIRYRDGSMGFFNNTDLDGYAGFNEVFPFLNWLVIETSSTRFKPTGVHVVYDAGGPVDGTTGGGSSTIANALANTIESPTAHVPLNLRVPGAKYCLTADCSSPGDFTDPSSGNAGSTGRVDPPWATTQAWQGLLGQNSFIEWGMKPFAPANGNVPGENGGINGEVKYASTRPFDDPALYLQLSWLPGVPNVTLNLYQVGTAPDGTRSLKLVDTTTTTSWDGWAQGFRSDGVSNMNCPGQEITSPFYYTLLDSRQWLNPTTPIPGGDPGDTTHNSRFKCYDGWSMLNQVQPAVYDGMYKFPSIIGRDPVTGAPTGVGSTNGTTGSRLGSNCTICVANPDDGTPMLPAGKYVVEMILPPGYELVKEEDKNLLIGDVYIAPVTQQFAGLGNIFIMPDQAAINAYYNKNNQFGLVKTTNFGLPRHEGDTGSVEQFWPCVGTMRVVPDWMSIFVGAQQNAPFAGASRPLCDRKEVILKDEMSVLAKFFIFSSTHVAGHYTGTITNDFASEFDPFSPQFGEKFAPPNLPVAFRDFAGNEVSRVYADQWGVFNGLYFSSWAVNPPNPTGYVPQMAIACMNDPGPIPGPNGTIITDPMYNPAYSNYCYETPFMPGQTQYMDSPVIPTMAFADNYNLPDCEYQDATPAIKSVLGDSSHGGQGPWVSAAGHTLTINALGDKPVLNHAYSGPQATTAPYNQKFITRHYGFGATQGAGSVTIGGRTASVTAWSDLQITVTVPNNVPACAVHQRNVSGTELCGQLEITAGNGKKSIDTVTVTIGGKAPTYVTPTTVSGTNFGQTSFGATFANPLQTAIDNAAAGDLIIVGPGTYRENLLMWKPVRLQGVGAESVTINADAHPAGKMDPWRRQVACLFGLSLNGRPLLTDGTFPPDPYDANGIYTCPSTMQQRVDRIPFEAIVGWDSAGNGNLAQLLQEPTLMGAYEGAGITVLGRGVRIPADSTDFWGASAAGGFPAGYEYLRNRNQDCNNANTARTDGLDYSTSNFLCNPSRIDGLSVINSSQGGGAIFAHAWNHNLEISNNRIHGNHGTLTGGITTGNGEFPDPFIIPDPADAAAVALPVGLPTTNSAGGQLGVGEQAGYGFNRNVNVHHNSVTANASIGDALYSGTPSAAGGVTFCSGADNYQFNYNWVCGNLSTGDGAGVAHAGFINDGTISHNTIIFNQSANPTIPTHGGGLGILAAPPDRTQNGVECGNDPNDVDCPPGLAEGTGRGLVIDANLIMGNSAEGGSGGGLRLQGVNGAEVVAFPTKSANWYEVTVTNNIIANNVAGWDGGGVSLQDALKVKFVNNTVVANDTTASAGVLFNTLGAPMAATPPPGCTIDPLTNVQTCPSTPVPTSTSQAAGLVTMQNTPNLTASLPPGANAVNCPNGYYGNSNTLCRQVSIPQLSNNLFWQNRAFHIGVGNLGPESLGQNQQKVVTLYPALNQSLTGMCATMGTPDPDTTATPINRSSAPVYWDIGVRNDTAPNNHASGFTLVPQYSILSATATDYTGNGNLVGADPLVLSMYCNGSRLPPENNGNLGSYNVPPGHSESTGQYPIFALNNITPAATVDEGNNWINLGYGPLSLVHPVTQAVLGNYAPVGTSSPAADAIPSTATTYAGAPPLDFFGTNRGKATNQPITIGAVEVDSRPQADVRITKTHTGTPPHADTIDRSSAATPASAAVQSAIQYTIVVTNAGPNPAGGTQVTDQMPTNLFSARSYSCTVTGGAVVNNGCALVTGAAINQTITTFPSGATVTFVANAIIDVNAPLGTFTNTAAVTLPNSVSDPDMSNNSASHSDTVVLPAADISITKTANKSIVVAGSTVTYTIVITNNGPSAVNAGTTGVTVTDVIPALLTGVTYTCSASGTGASCGGALASGSGNPFPRTFNIGNIHTAGVTKNDTVTFTVTGTVPVTATGTLSNTATVSVPVDRRDPNPANNSATVEIPIQPIQHSDLSITKTDGVTTVLRGTSVTYTITVSNAGPDAVTGASVVDTMPAVLTGVTWTCLASAGSSCTAASGSGNIGTTVNLLNGGTATFTVNGTVLATASGTLSNTATAAVPAGWTDPTPGNNSATDTDTITAPTLTSVSPTSGLRGTTVALTLTGTNLAGANAVTVSGNGPIACSITGTPNATTVTANCVIPPGANLTARNVTVTTTANGNTNTLTNAFTVVNPLTATLNSISPTSGARGASITMTLNGANFTATGTTVAVSGAGITPPVVTSVNAAGTQITATFSINASANLTARNVTVTNPNGTPSSAQTFTVTP